MVKKPEKNQKKNTNTTTRPWIVVAGILLGVLAVFVILMLLIPQKAILRTSMSGENSTKLTTGYYDFHVLGVDTFDDKKVLDQTFADVYVENGRYELKISLPKYLASTRVATTVCYSTQGSEKPNGFKGEIDGLKECDSTKLKSNSNIYDAKDCVRILNVIHPNTLFGWLFGWREGIFEEGCERFGGSAFLSESGDTDRQGLQLNGNELTISNGNTVILPIFGGSSGGSTTNTQNLTTNNVTNTTETTNNFLDCTDCLTTTLNPWVAQADIGPNSDVFANSIVDFIGGDALSTTNDGSRNITFDINPGVGVDTTGDAINVLVAGPITINGSNQITLGPCGTNETLQYDGTNWICVSIAGTYSYILAGDLGVSSVIDSGDTALISGGAGLISTGGGADNVTLDVNPGIAISTLGDAINVIEGDGIDTTGNQVNVTAGTAIDTTGDAVNVRFAGPIIVNGSNQITIQPCTSVNDVLAWDGTNWVCNPGGGLYTWTLAGDSGANQIVSNTDIATIIGGNGVSTVVGATDNLTVDINPGIAIDLTGDAVNVRFAGPIALNGSNQLTLQPCATNEILRFDGTNWICDATTFTARHGLINVGTDEDPIVDALANNGLRVDPQSEDDSIQLGARFDDPSEKPEANLVFNTEVPQNNFSIAWTGTRLTEPNSLFGLGTTPGATPDPNSTGLSNLNERLDVVGNIENIADSADPPELVTSSGAGCTSPTNIGENPSQVFSQGRYTYVFIQNDASAGPRQLQIFDNQNPRCVRLVNTINLRSGVNNDHIGYVSGHNAYAIDRGGYFMSVDVSNPFPLNPFPPVATQLYNPANFTGTPLSNPVIPTSMHVEGNYAYITLDDPDNGPQDLDYMIVVDISTISSPRLVRTVNLRPFPPNPNPVFNPTSIYIQDRYAYVVGSAGGFGGGLMTIIDISNPRGATIANPNNQVFPLPPSNAPTDVFVQDRYAYVTSAFGAGFAVYDISNPQSLPGIVSAIGGNPSTSVVVSGRYAYTSGSFNVIDVQNPQAANIVSTFAGVSPTAFTINGRFGYYIFDQGVGIPGQFGVLDTHGIETTAILAHAVETGGLQVQTNAVVNNQLQVGGSVTIGDALSVQGDASVAGNFENLSSTRNNPTAIANSTTFTIPNTPNETTGMKVVGNYGYVIGRNNSTNISVLMVYDTTQPNQPRYLSQVTLDNSPGPPTYPRTGERPTAIEVRGRYAYVANSESNTLQTVDISNPNIPTVVSSVAIGTGDPSDIKSMAINDRYIVVMSPPVGSGNSTFNMFDIGNPAAPVNKVSGLIGCVDVSDVYISNNYIYITCPDTVGNTGTVIVYDANLTIRSGILTFAGGFAPSLATPLRRPQSVWVQDNRAYVLFSEDNTSFGNLNDYLAVYDVTNPGAATLLGFSQPLGSMGLTQPGTYQNFHGVNLQVSGKYAYIAGFRSSPNPFQNFNEIQLYDISNPTVPADNINSYQDATIRPLGSTRVTNSSSPGLIGSSRVLSISGKYLYSSIHDTTNPNTNQLVVYDLHGADIANLLVNNAKIGALEVAGPSEFDGSVNIVNGVTIGQNLNVNGDASFNGDITMLGRQAITSAVAPTNTTNASKVIKQGSLMYVMRPGSNQISMFRPTYTDFNPLLSLVGAINTSAGMVDIASSGRFVYALSNNAGTGILQSFDNTTGTSAGQTNLPAGFIPANITVSGKNAYVSGFDTNSGSGFILVYDISAQSSGLAPRAPRLVATGTYGGTTNLTEIKIRDNVLFALEPAAGLMRTYNILTPTATIAPGSVGSVAAPGANKIAVDGDMIYTISSSLNTLTSYSMPNTGANTPVLNQTLSLPGSPSNIRAADRTVYITGDPSLGFRAVDVTNPFTGMQLQPPGSTIPFIDSEVFGRVSVAITQGGGQLHIFNLGSAYIQSLESGEVVTHGLTVIGGKSQTQDLDVNGALSVSMSSNFRKDVSIYDNLNVGLNSSGISTAFTDLFRFSVIGNSQGVGNTAAPFSAIAAITNGNTTDSGANNVLRLNTATDPTGTQSRFVRFFAGVTTDADGIAVGNIRLNNNAVAYTTAGADFAERVDVGEATEAGDIIGVHSGGNRKAVSGDKLIGVVSDTAGFIGNDREGQNDADAIVGMVGQVRTKVSTENGAIRKGDLITVSSIAGVGMKAKDSSEAVGKAMEDFTCTNTVTVCQGAVKVYVDPQYYDADILSQADIDGLLAINADSGLGTQESETLDQPAQSDGVAAPSETSSPRLKDLLTGMQTQIGTQQASIDALNVQVSQLQAFINSGALAGDITLGGNVLVAGDLTLGGDNAGKATVPATETSVQVNFATPKATIPSVDLQFNPDSTTDPELLQAYLNGELRMIARDVSTTGFTIQINQAQLKNLKLNWTAIEQK